MKNVNINLNEELLERVDRLADDKGLSRSEIVRRLLDEAVE